MPNLLSKIYSLIKRDDPVVIDSKYSPNANDRRFLDNQIQGIEQHLVDSLIQGRHATWFKSTGGTLAIGDVVCSDSIQSTDEFQGVIKITASAIANAKTVIGVVIKGGNSYVLVATGGVIPATITGLALNTAGVVRANLTTGRCEYVGTFSAGDYPVGTLSIGGNLTISTSIAPEFLNIGGAATTFTLDSGSADIVSGDWVVHKPGSSNPLLVTKATPTNAQQVGDVLGCVDASYTHGASGVVVRRRGEVVPASAFSDLGAGTASRLQMNSSGRASRQATWTGGEIALGTIDSSGNVTVGQYVPINTSPSHRLNPKTFGCLWDGTTDDLAGFQAMLASIPFPLNSAMPHIDLPPGPAYFSGKLTIDKPCIARGKGQSSTVLKFAPAPYSGLAFEGNGDGATWEDFAATSQILQPGLQPYSINTGRANSTAYALNSTVCYIFGQGSAASISAVSAPVVEGNGRSYNTVTLTGLTGMTSGSVGHLLYISQVANPKQQGVYLITHFNSATSVDVRIFGGVATTDLSGGIFWEEFLPYFFRATTPGISTSSGTSVLALMAAVTQAGTAVPDGTVVWTSEAYGIDYQIGPHVYKVGDRVFATGDNRYVFECVTGGTAAATDANFYYPGDTTSIPPAGAGGTFTDGPDTLVWRTLDASGITIRTGFITLDNFRVEAFTCAALHITNTYSGPTTNADHNIARNWQSLNCGIGIVTDGDDANANTIGEVRTFTMGRDRAYRDTSKACDGGHTVWDRGEVNFYHDLYAQSGRGPEVAYYATGQSAGAFNNARGETVLGDIMTASSAQTGAVSQTPAATSPHMVVSPQRCFNMATASRLAVNMITAVPGFGNGSGFDLRDGIQQLGVSGDWIGWERSSTHTSLSLQTGSGGASGTGWNALQGFTYYSRLMVGWSDGEATTEGAYNWRHYSGFYCGLANPYIWGVDANDITDAGFRAAVRNAGDVFYFKSTGAAGTWAGRVISGAGGYRAPTWTANAPVFVPHLGGGLGSSYYAFPGTTVEPTTSNGFVYVASTGGFTHASTEPTTVTRRWSAGSPVALNDLIVPTHAHWNGYFYKATSVSGTPVTGGAEPTWPTGTGGTVTDNPGPNQVVWTRQLGAYGLQSGEITNDNGVVWTWLGVRATNNWVGFIDDPIAALTPQTRILWKDTTSTDATTANAKGAVASFRAEASTSTNAGGQLLYTIDDALFSGVAGNLVSNAVYEVDLVITAKSPAATSEAGSCKLSGTFYIAAGNLVRVGTDSNVPNFLTGTTYALDIATSPKKIGVTTTPGINAALGHQIVGQIIRKID